MNIEWDYDVSGGRTSVVARIPAPSNIRHAMHLGMGYGAKPMTHITVALYQKDADTEYRVAFIPAIQDHFDPPYARLKTELGAKRRIRKYAELWAIAGYPGVPKTNGD